MSDKLKEKVEAEVDTKPDPDVKKDEKNKKKGEADKKPMDDKDPEDVTQEAVRITKAFKVGDLNLTEEVNTLFNGSDVSEEFKAKITTVFETALVARLNPEIEKIEEEAQEAISVYVAEVRKDLAEEADAFMEPIVEQWAEENKLAIEQGLRSQIAEDFLTDLRGLFEKHNINIPQEKVEVLENSEKENETLKAEVNKLNESLLVSQKEIMEMKKEKIVKGLSEGMVMTQSEKLASLVKEIDTKDLAIFEEKAKTIKSSLFTEEKKPDADKTKGKVITESGDASMDKLLSGLKKLNNND